MSILNCCCPEKKRSGKSSSDRIIEEPLVPKKKNPSKTTTKQTPAKSTQTSQSRTPLRSILPLPKKTSTKTDLSKTKQRSEVDTPEMEKNTPHQRQTVIDHNSHRLKEDKSKASSDFEAATDFSFSQTLVKSTRRPQLSDNLDLDDVPEMRKEQSQAKQDAEVEELF
ncbi:hypothetical protein BLNAU_18985 [Blattamonas nauphoetae]|uniref:Uncharacterized protein n=1 Tax=Blattamonas nauphoetae TaxID=2049346 RepID=A0ABQ9X574_9EUKA|nr:hypothetical protein BLNAU_18985 [Blattamonas nauphoetae]